MSTKTTNYELIKPADNETADIQVINGNMDIIDTKLKENAEAIATHKAEIVTEPAPNKILKLNANSKLPASITGDSATVGTYKFSKGTATPTTLAENEVYFQYE